MKKLFFKSAQFEAKKAFGAYHDLYSGGSDVTCIGDRFLADVVGYRFPRMLVFDRHLRCVSHERKAKRVSRDNFDHVMIQVVLSGEMWIDTNDDPRAARAGDVILFDLTKPQRTWTREARIATASIAREVVDQNLRLPQDLHGQILQRDKGGFLGDHIVALGRHAETMAPEMTAAATMSVGTLLAATIEVTKGSMTTPLHSLHKIDRALKFIDANLKNPHLTVGAILKETGMSRSVLYRAFEPVGGVVACIQERRLLGVRRTLAQPRDARSINAIMEDHGFTSASTGNRAFRDAYGQPPGAFRASLESSRAEDPAIPYAALAGEATAAKAALNKWHIELR